MVPLGGLAHAGNKGGGNFCPGRNNTCGGSGGSGGGTGQTVDACDNRADGQYLIDVNVLITCNNFDVTSIIHL